MNILFYDTETTDLPDWKAPSDGPGQPHIVQIAALLVDESNTKLGALDFIIAPEGEWDMTPEALEKHGITEEKARGVGSPPSIVFNAFYSLWARSDVRVGFSEGFDARMLRIEFARLFGKEAPHSVAWKNGKAEDVMRIATPICKIPPTDAMLAAGRTGHKTPKLVEAYNSIMDTPMFDAHSAMGDVIATRALYFRIFEMQEGAE